MHQHVSSVETIGRLSVESTALQTDECSAIWNGVRGRLLGWSREFFTDPFGELNLIIMPPNADDDIGPMLIVYKQRGLYIIAAFRWDEYSHVGTYHTLDGTVAEIESTLFSTMSHGARPASAH